MKNIIPKKNIPIIILLLLSSLLKAQDYTQTIRGKVNDRESKTGLTGVAIALMQDTIIIDHVITDDDGRFRFDHVKIGTYTLHLRYIGYKEQWIPNITLNSGRESVLNIDMEENAIQLKEAVVHGKQKGELRNEMALVSARAFDSEETERYPGSRQDPARMASNFAGVNGNDDSRNDIVIRGNSPQGLLFRIEGIDMPNANHFALPGTTGSEVSMLNNKVIGASDFMTGAFPAEYGNAIAGVFDIHFRNGNTETFENTIQAGVLGLEAASEGPLSKNNNSSYLVAYRYSTLSVAHDIGLDLGTSSVPVYQDINFKLNFQAGKNDDFSVFGVAGLSRVAIVMSQYTKPTKEIYGSSDLDIYDTITNGFVGGSWGHIINNSAYMKFTIAQTYYSGAFTNDRIRRNSDFSIDTIYRRLRTRYVDERSIASWLINKKINSRNILTAGIYGTRIYTSILDNQMNEDSLKWMNRANVTTTAYLLQPYIQYKFKWTETLELTGGIHGQYYTFSNSKSVEPRASIRWHFAPKHTLSLGGGMHSETDAINVYYIHQPTYGTTASYNDKLDFVRSIHSVASYDYSISSDFRIKIESYFQYLYNVPITRYRSSFSGLNEGATNELSSYDTLTNKGIGRNYGLEFTLEKFFSHHYFLLATATLFRSQYQGSDQVWRRTDFDGRFITNILGGREFRIGKNSLTFSGKLSWAGGRLYSPVDTAATQKAKEIVAVDSKRNSLQFNDYFRLDIKIAYKINTKKLTHEISIDLINVTNHQNLLSYDYAFSTQGKYQIEYLYQLGFLPLVYYKIDF